MVVQNSIRISKEFDDWLNSNKLKTGLSKSALTKLVAFKLNGVDVIEIPVNNRRMRIMFRKNNKPEPFGGWFDVKI